MERGDLGRVSPIDTQGSARGSAYFIEECDLRAALREMNIDWTTNGPFVQLMVEDRPYGEPVCLPPPVRGFYGLPSIEKLCHNNAELELVELMRRIRAVADRRAARAAAAQPRPEAAQPRPEEDKKAQGS